MGIKFLCPNGHKLHVKSFLASQRGVCPKCGEKFLVPAQSLPDIRVESLGAKDSKRKAAAATSPANRSLGAALASEDFAPEQDLGDAGDLTTAGDVVSARDVIPTNDSAGAVRGKESGRDSAFAPAPSPLVAADDDPIAQAPGAMWYVRIANGEQFGPAQGDLMQRWLNEGRVAGDSLVWREGWAEWATAGKIFRQLSLDSAPAVPGSIDAFERGLAEQVESLVLPTQTAGNAIATGDAASDSRAKTSGLVGAKKLTKSQHRMALVILVVTVVCLLPALIFVLLR